MALDDGDRAIVRDVAHELADGLREEFAKEMAAASAANRREVAAGIRIHAAECEARGKILDHLAECQGERRFSGRTLALVSAGCSVLAVVAAVIGAVVAIQQMGART